MVDLRILCLRFIIAALGASAAIAAFAAEPAADEPLRVAVYDVPPYGYVSPDGSISGLSVDLWRRVAERMQRQFRLTPVEDMESVLAGLEQGRFDAAVGAITITPERSERVDFSYPAHRSGVAVAVRRDEGLLSALQSYGAALSALSSLILATVALLGLTGLAMWAIERSHHSVAQGHESSVATLRDGLYWAVVTMTTVGYGDKTPKTTAGRVVAIAWMMSSLVLVSLLSTSLVSRLTADRVETAELTDTVDLTGKRLGAVALSSGAEYLDGQRAPYAKYRDLPEALDALVDGRIEAVVNSIGALRYAIGKRYARKVELPRGLLAPAYMAFALPPHSPLKRPIDRALMTITANPEWRALEDGLLGR